MTEELLDEANMYVVRIHGCRKLLDQIDNTSRVVLTDATGKELLVNWIQEYAGEDYLNSIRTYAEDKLKQAQEDFKKL